MYVHQCITDPATGKDGRIVQFTEALSHSTNVSVTAGGERDNAVLKDENVHLRRGRDAMSPRLISGRGQ